jgi:hypothetical protein
LKVRGLRLKAKQKDSFFLLFLEPFAYAAMTMIESNPDGIGTDRRFPVASFAGCGKNISEVNTRDIMKQNGESLVSSASNLQPQTSNLFRGYCQE